MLQGFRSYPHDAHVGVEQAKGERIVVNAGLRSLSCQRSISVVKHRPGLSVRRLSAEQGIIDPKDPVEPVEVGDRIEIWVQYSGATVHLHDRLWGDGDGQVGEAFRVDG